MMPRTWHSCHPMDLQKLARQWFVSARRIELKNLAVELGISRATAYRWAGSAEQLVGTVLASIVDDTFANLMERTSTTGAARVLDVLDGTMRAAHAFQPLRQFLARDARLALKIIASSNSPVRERTVANIEQLLRAEIDTGNLTLALAPGDVAGALTRIFESFVYTDLITGTEPDLDAARRALELTLNTG